MMVLGRRSLFSLLFPFIAGLILIALAFPYIESTASPLIGEVAYKWGWSYRSVRMLIVVGAAMLLVIIFHILKRLSMIVAIIAVLLMMFSPVGLYGIKIDSPESLVAYAKKVAEDVPILTANDAVFYQTYIYDTAKQPVEKIVESTKEMPEDFWYLTNDLKAEVDKLFPEYRAVDEVQVDGFQMFRLEKSPE